MSNCWEPVIQYMGNEIFIQNRKVCVQALRNRLEGDTKAPTPNHSERM